jgi:hypothetical protein
MLAIVLHSDVFAYEKVRFYKFGEDDPGATIGGVALSTSDSQSSPMYMGGFTDGPNFDPPNVPTGEEFVDLFAVDANSAPKYVAGRLTGLALEFGGDDYLEAATFDPRPNSKGEWTEINPEDFSFTTVSQAWVKPSSAGAGSRQVLWTVGPENGGIAITPEGFFEIIHPNRVLSNVAVDFDDWHHLTMRRHGNGAVLYIDGEVVGESSGFWGGPGTLTVGAGLTGLDPYVGQLDEFNLSVYRGPGTLFDPAHDIDFFSDLRLSGVLGDVDQDSDVDNDDYQIWSANAGFDNGIGFGDPSTLLLGDIDQNGRINYFDFQVIAEQAAMAGVALNQIPEPSAAWLMLWGTATVIWRRRSR